MNKTELISKVAKTTQLTKKNSEKAVQAVLESIQTALAAGNKVQLVGFGTFETRERAARKGRNPQTGKTIKINARRAPVFKPGKKLKESVH